MLSDKYEMQCWSINADATMERKPTNLSLSFYVQQVDCRFKASLQSLSSRSLIFVMFGVNFFKSLRCFAWLEKGDLRCATGLDFAPFNTAVIFTRSS